MLARLTPRTRSEGFARTCPPPKQSSPASPTFGLPGFQDRHRSNVLRSRIKLRLSGTTGEAIRWRVPQTLLLQHSQNIGPGCLNRASRTSQAEISDLLLVCHGLERGRRPERNYGFEPELVYLHF